MMATSLFILVYGRKPGKQTNFKFQTELTMPPFPALQETKPDRFP